jgi:hypothetical protein
LGTVVRKKFGRFHPELSQTQLVCGHHTNQDTAGALHILNTDLVSDVTMCQLLSLADLGHIISLCGATVTKKFGRFHPELSKTQLFCSHRTNQDTAGDYNILNGGLLSDVTMSQLLSVADLGHIMSFLMLCSVRKLQEISSKLRKKPAGLQPSHQSGHCWSISYPQ